MKTIQVLLCDDHALFREGIRASLSSDDTVNIMAEAENGEECIAKLAQMTPDVILLDINMPVIDGIQALQIIKKDYPEIKVLALTQYDEKRFVKQMLKFGADGYILKTTTKRELTHAIHHVLKGHIYLSDEAEAKMQNLDKEAEPNPLFPQLTERELEIIRMLCHELSTKQIADRINLSVHTIESHRSNIFKKIGVSNVAGLVRWAVNNGKD